MYMFAVIANLFKKNRSPAPSDVEGQRHNDGVLLVQQDNSSKKILIQASNLNCQNLLGYDNNEIMGKDLREFLTESEIVEINDFTEFEDGKKDFAEVLSKMRYFKMLTKAGDYMPLRLRLVRSISQQNKPSFQLVFNDDVVSETIDRKRQVYRLGMRGDEIFDDLTGMLSYESVIKDIEILSFYEGKRKNSSVLVAFEITNLEELTKSLTAEDIDFIKISLGQAIDSCKREEDISAKIAQGTFLLVLVETPETNITIPATRVRAKFEQIIVQKHLSVAPELQVKNSKISAEIEAEEQVASLLA